MDKKVVILGAGVSGLSAGIYALQAGYSVEIYEKNKVCPAVSVQDGIARISYR